MWDLSRLFGYCYYATYIELYISASAWVAQHFWYPSSLGLCFFCLEDSIFERRNSVCLEVFLSNRISLRSTHTQKLCGKNSFVWFQVSIYYYRRAQQLLERDQRCFPSPFALNSIQFNKQKTSRRPRSSHRFIPGHSTLLIFSEYAIEIKFRLKTPLAREQRLNHKQSCPCIDLSPRPMEVGAAIRSLRTPTHPQFHPDDLCLETTAVNQGNNNPTNSNNINTLPRYFLPTNNNLLLLFHRNQSSPIKALSLLQTRRDTINNLRRNNNMAISSITTNNKWRFHRRFHLFLPTERWRRHLHLCPRIRLRTTTSSLC